jgi:hypothetical protein
MHAHVCACVQVGSDAMTSMQQTKQNEQALGQAIVAGEALKVRE